MKCPSCGADISPAEVQCSHCGSHVPANAHPSKAAVFARIKASDEYESRYSLQRLARLPNVAGLQKAFFSIFMLFFIGSSGLMAVIMLGMAGAFGLFGFRVNGGWGASFSLVPLLMAVVPICFVIFGVLLLRHLQQKWNSMEKAPVEALPVIVIGKRMEVSGGGDRMSRTAYFITCETEDGGRQEYQVWDGKLYGRLTADDAGIVFVRAGYGLDFDRVAI